MSSSVWPQIASGLIGVAGALGGTWFTQRATRQREEATYQRSLRDKRDDRLQVLYLDMAQHVENANDWALRVVNGHVAEDEKMPEYPTRTVLLTARVDLHASAGLFNAWVEYAEIADEFQTHGNFFDEWDREMADRVLSRVEKVREELRSAAR